MEKLKPILAHKFWIGYGLAVLLPMIAWWLATSNLAAETKKRTDAIVAANSKANVAPDTPNQIWIGKLTELNQSQDQLVDSSRESLWVTQQKLQKFPPQSATYMQGVGYRQQGSSSNVQLVYQQEYDSELQRLRDVVRPFDSKSDKGVVYIPITALPNPPSYGTPNWGAQPLSWDELWDTVEDNWLIEDLLSSIDAVNRDYDSIAEAPIRGVVKLELHGGQPRKLAEEEGSDAANGPAPDGMDPSGMPGMPGGMPPGMGNAMRIPGGGDAAGGGRGGFGGRGRGAGAGGGQQFDNKPPVSFDPVEVFGSPQEVAAAAGDGAAMPGGGPPGLGAPGLGAPGLGAPGIAGAPSMGGGAGAAGSGKARRYVDDGEELPFRTRGFYLELVMNHESVPILIAQLTTSNWPVEILRVHQQDLYEDDIPGVNGGESGDGMPAGRNAGPGSNGGRSMPGADAAGGRGMPAAGAGSAAGGESMTSPVLALFGGGGQGAGGMPGAAGGRNMPGAGGGAAGRFGMPRANFSAGGRNTGGGASAQPPMSEQEKKGRQTLAAAMNDKDLVHVAIAGLLTLYSPPQVKPESDPSNPSTPGAPGTGVASSPATNVPTASTSADGTPVSDLNPVPTTGDPKAGITAAGTPDPAKSPLNTPSPPAATGTPTVNTPGSSAPGSAVKEPSPPGIKTPAKTTPATEPKSATPTPKPAESSG